MSSKFTITRNGFVCKLDIDPNTVLTFKIFNTRKNSLINYGEKTYEWIIERFGSHKIELLYSENEKLTLIANSK